MTIYQIRQDKFLSIQTLVVGMLDAIMVMHGSLTVLILVRKIAVT